MLPNVHSQSVSCHLCGCPVLQTQLVQQPLFPLWDMTVRSPGGPLLLQVQAQAAAVGATLLPWTANLSYRQGRCCAVMLRQARNTTLMSWLSDLPSGRLLNVLPWPHLVVV